MRTLLALVITTAFATAAVGASPARQKAGPQTIAIAAASDLRTVVHEIAADFEKATGIRATLSFGSSGSFFAQIQNGAPFDVFFSADVEYPRRLVADGRAESDTLYEYATGTLVLWTRKDSGVDVTHGLAVLRDPRVRRIAIANPDFAPYGRAAVAALRSAHLYDDVRGKLVFGENIAQAAQLAESGNADAALTAHSLALTAAMRNSGVSVDIPPEAYPPIVQAAVVVSSSKNQRAGRRLLHYLQGAQAQETLAAFGFRPPPGR